MFKEENLVSWRSSTLFLRQRLEIIQQKVVAMLQLLSIANISKHNFENYRNSNTSLLKFCSTFNISYKQFFYILANFPKQTNHGELWQTFNLFFMKL